MPRIQEPAITNDELGLALRAADPRARLVSSRILRRVIKGQQKLGLIGFHRAHRKSLTVATATALKAVESRELDPLPGEALPDTLLLIEVPDSNDLQGLSRGDALLWAWRMLFHCAVHAEVASRGLTEDQARARLEMIGSLASEEIRAVLDRDGWLLTPSDVASVYEEFVAVFLEFRHFSGGLLPVYFPAIDDFDRVDEIVSADLDGHELFARTRIEGASDPHDPEPLPMAAACVPMSSSDEVVKRSESTYRWLIGLAERAARVGNVVQAAIYRTRAAKLAGPSRAGQARSKADDELNSLARRLRNAVGDEACEIAGWKAALAELLNWTASGLWTVEARLLHDLQNACVDFERAIYTVDLLGWIFTLGRRPLRRALPNQTLVRMAKHLQKASRRVFKSRLSDVHRASLTLMLDTALRAAEARVRERFRPLIAQALSRARWKPTNLPERVSFDKMVEELADRIVGRNFLTMGDVRDAISRSQLRAPTSRVSANSSRATACCGRTAGFAFRWTGSITRAKSTSASCNG